MAAAYQSQQQKPISIPQQLRRFFFWRPEPDMQDQFGKVAIVSGGSSGIGFQVVRALAAKHATVINASHNLPAAHKALRDIHRDYPYAKVINMYLDISSVSSIKTFVDDVKALGLPIHIFVNCAGEAMGPPGPGGDKVLPNHTMAVNYWGPFLLTHLMIPQLRASAPSRIINTCSLLGEYMGSIDWDDLLGKGLTKAGNPLASYNRSKKMYACFTRDLARRVQGEGIDVFAVHPGFAGTQLWHKSEQHHPSARMFAWAEEWFAQHPYYGALPALYAATEPSLQGRGGQYFGPNRMNIFPTHAGDYWGSEARDLATCAKLYDTSLKVVVQDMLKERSMVASSQA